MAKKLINTEVKLGRGTVLIESFTGDVIEKYLGAGQSINLPDGINGVIVYYTLRSTNYVKSSFIPRVLFDPWFYDVEGNASIYFRVWNKKLEVSDISTGPGRIRAYQLVY